MQSPTMLNGRSDLTTCPKGQVWSVKKKACMKRAAGLFTDDEPADYAFALAKAKRFDEALDTLDQIEGAPTPKAWNYRGYATRKLGRTDEGIGYYLKSGYGLKQNQELALKYIRKAADLGNPDAQYYVAGLLAPHDRAPDIARQMRRCAADQGHGRAAYELAINLAGRGDSHGAVLSYQKGVAAGGSGAAMSLEEAFRAPESVDKRFALEVPKDPERSRRYQLIGEFLDNNTLANPKVPDVDQVVPLPPAKLPPWDGTFEWEKQRAQVPPKPPEELIDRLAKEKHLDPATGWPLSADAQTSQTSAPDEVVARLPLGSTARTGMRCPEGGVWCAQLRPGLQAEATRTFEKGEVLPMIDFYEPRALPWLDRVMGERRLTTDVVSKLVAYEDKACSRAFGTGTPLARCCSGCREASIRPWSRRCWKRRSATS